ncbi:MAG: serine/threonine-protein kinase [Hydrogenophaga sp.]|nr:serine/threonine-protein kinase [Hydrogenophaga sp.]
MPPASEDDLPTRLQDDTTSASDDADSVALPIGTRLAEFEIQDKIGEGGFSTVYRAWDHVLMRQVALKEYFPSSIASRSGHTQVSARSQRHRDTFQAGLDSFIKEAQTLAGFDHPSLVKVLRFFPANGTAYMVMPLYQGATLRDAVRDMGTRPDEAWLLAQLDPLTQALQSIHAQGWYHRDIAPDNIMLIDGGSRPLLLDFGAARRVIGDMTQALTVILKPGYAPVEQYAEVPGMKQGPWTDVYALAATMHWAITGNKPPAAVGRMVNDTLEPLAQAAAGRYSPRFLAALDAALKVRPTERTADMGQFRQALGLGAPVVAPAAPAPIAAATAAAPGPAVRPRPPTLASPLPAWSWAAGLALVLAAGGTWWWSQRPAAPEASPVVESPSVSAPAPSPPAVAVPTPVPLPAPAPVASPAPAPLPAPVPSPVVKPAPVAKTEPRAVAPVRAEAPARAAAPRPSSVCSGLMQRLSLGEDSPALREQLVANRCQ